MNNYKALKIKGVKFDIHRRVMENHLGRKLSRNEVVHHIDGDKSNNVLSNLRVMTLSEHSRMHMLEIVKDESVRERLKLNGAKAPKGSKNINAKLDENKVADIKNMRASGMTMQKIADYFEVSKTTIKDVLHGVTWRHLLKDKA